LLEAGFVAPPNLDIHADSALTPETLDEQIQKESWTSMMWQAALVLVAFACVVVLVIVAIRYFQAADPYIREVLSLGGDPSRGRAIFQMNCAVCHGLEGNGEVGPTLLGVADHKTRVELIRQVISGQTPPMPQFQPNPQDMADLLNYLEQL
jgi:mono/diheme cytochrome c family protein